MKRKDIKKAAMETNYGFAASRGDLEKFLTDFAVREINATLKELLDDLKQVSANFKGGTALGMLETVQEKIRARMVKPFKTERTK